MKTTRINNKKTKLLRLVISLDILYSMVFILLDSLQIIPHVEFRAEALFGFIIINTVLLYISIKSRKFNILILNLVLLFALLLFSTMIVLSPQNDNIRLMWYFFTIIIAYYIGGQKTGHATAIASVMIIFTLNSILNLNFNIETSTSIIIGILFISQLSNYFITILNENEVELEQYHHHLEDMIERGLKEISNLNEEITDTQKEVVFTMGAIGESRSKETGNHVKRVAQYSKILALAVGMDEDEAELLRMASPMHDIGKVAISDSILNKPARFTPEEFDIMKTHAQLGYEMLKSSNRPILKTASTVAYEHHERWDGKGYPQGLKGENIHIYGRITAIADVFDALGSSRVYKDAWDDEKIFNLFREEQGKQFDPKLVDIFFDNLDDILKIRNNFKDK